MPFALKIAKETTAAFQETTILFTVLSQVYFLWTFFYYQSEKHTEEFIRMKKKR